MELKKAEMGAGNCSLSRKRPKHILMLGLDDSGKTTILYKLRINEVLTTIPTIGFNLETLNCKGTIFDIMDVGGQEKIRSLWRHYYPNTDDGTTKKPLKLIEFRVQRRRTDLCAPATVTGLFYVVNCADEERLGVARDELYKILNSREMDNIPLVVLANKQDLPGAVDATMTEDILNLNDLRHRPWHVQPTCAVTGNGLKEAMEFMAACVKKR